MQNLLLSIVCVITCTLSCSLSLWVDSKFCPGVYFLLLLGRHISCSLFLFSANHFHFSNFFCFFCNISFMKTFLFFLVLHLSILMFFCFSKSFSNGSVFYQQNSFPFIYWLGQKTQHTWNINLLCFVYCLETKNSSNKCVIPYFSCFWM